MKKLRVITPSDVRHQIRDQVFYIARDSVDDALAWEDRLEAAINGLANFHGHAIDEEATARLGHIKYNRLPIDGHLGSWDAEHGDFAAVGHVGQQVAEGGGVAGHFPSSRTVSV